MVWNLADENDEVVMTPKPSDYSVSVLLAWELDDKVANVGDYKISKKLASVLKKLLDKYEHICANCNLSTALKNFFFLFLCEVVQRTCNIVIMNVQDDFMFDWWSKPKFVQGEGIRTNFAFQHLQSIVHAHCTTNDDESYWDSKFYMLREKKAQHIKEMDELEAKLEECRNQIEEDKKQIEDVISSHPGERSRRLAESLSNTLELKLKKAREGLLK